jgi:2-polyprenyl-3-methyl-5-hydroxy-6-metoxy-1,4-benzoquinol methylase
MGYGIKDGYRENPGPVYFLDDVTATRRIVFQPDVYRLAELVTRQRYDEYEITVVDVGCGQADKLEALKDRQRGWAYVGIDYGANIAACRQRYQWATWIEADLEEPLDLTVHWETTVICSDVLEHLVNPNTLLASLRKSEAGKFVFSTPERDVQHGYDHTGPSPNLCHVREWNAAEFHQLLTDAGFNVEYLGLTRGSDQGWAMATQVAVCT